jgi:hypothetical protein
MNMIRLPASVRYLVFLGVVAGLLFGSGCASRPDWIESTLVTVDVTGRWNGTLTAESGFTSFVNLTMDQKAARVIGTIRGSPFGPPSGALNATLEGTIAGDVVRFLGPDFQGEARVDGDEMTGTFYVADGRGKWGGRLSLRRGDRAAPPPVSRP